MQVLTVSAGDLVTRKAVLGRAGPGPRVKCGAQLVKKRRTGNTKRTMLSQQRSDGEFRCQAVGLETKECFTVESEGFLFFQKNGFYVMSVLASSDAF